MVVTDLVNIVAGAYKGWLNAGGQDVDPTCLLQVLGSTSVLSGLYWSLYVAVKKNNEEWAFNYQMVHRSMGEWREPSPIKDGIRKGLSKVPRGAVEIGAGYVLGYFAHKLIS